MIIQLSILSLNFIYVLQIHYLLSNIIILFMFYALINEMSKIIEMSEVIT